MLLLALLTNPQHPKHAPEALHAVLLAAVAMWQGCVRKNLRFNKLLVLRCVHCP